MTDAVTIKLTQERAELLGTQFREHNNIIDGVFQMCVCEDCALYRTWTVTTMVAQQSAMAVLTAGMVQGLGLIDLVAGQTTEHPPPEDNEECGHCVHYHEVRQGFANPAVVFANGACCYCGSMPEVPS